MKDDIRQGELFPVIPHKLNQIEINQREDDGYINATAMCKAVGKLFKDYKRMKATKEFLEELSSEGGIPLSELVIVRKGGIPSLQGTWVHPDVAVNLGQWASAKVAVQVAKWVREWMNGGRQPYKMPDYLRRYHVNAHKVPRGYFSMLNEMTIQLLGPLERKGYYPLDKMMPDISMGKMFCKWLRAEGYEPDGFPAYLHVFDDGRRRPVNAKLYPFALMEGFQEQLESWLKDGRALKYFGDRDPAAIAPLKQIYLEMPQPPKSKILERKAKK